MSRDGISMLVVDDHMIIRRGLIQILAECEGLGPFREAGDGPVAIQAMRESPADVVLLDVALGDRDGLDVLKTLRGEFPQTGVVMLSVYPESQFAVRAIRAGAGAYLNKGCSPDELVEAIRRVAGGGVYVTASIAELLARNVREPHSLSPHENLSNREFQVLELFIEGFTVAEIAQRLSLSGNTISTYRARIFEKLDVKSMAALLGYAARHNLLSR